MDCGSLVSFIIGSVFGYAMALWHSYNKKGE